MFKTILYPTDFSDTAGKTVAYLKELRKTGAQKVIILNIIHQRIIDTLETIHKAVYFQDGRYEEDLESAQKRLITEREQLLAPLVKELESAGYQVKPIVRIGHPAREILNVEKEEDITVITMGSHGKNNFRMSRIGSVSGKIVRRSLAPVLIVKR